MKAIYKQINQYLTYCEKVRKMSKVTLCSKRYILTRFANTTKIRNLRKMSNTTLDSYMVRLSSGGASGRSINTYNATIIAFVKYYTESGTTIPFKPVLVQKMKETKIERKFYTSDEIRIVINSAQPEAGLIIRIMFETGMRISEVTHLKVSDFDGQRIRFVGKGQKIREVYVRKETQKLIKDYIDKNNAKDFLWGISANGEPPTTNTIRKWLQEAFTQAGFSGFYPHALRHSFATNLQLKGASIAEIKEMMGHANIATTERYLHGFDGKMKELFEKYK